MYVLSPQSATPRFVLMHSRIIAHCGVKHRVRSPSDENSDYPIPSYEWTDDVVSDDYPKWTEDEVSDGSSMNMLFWRRQHSELPVVNVISYPQLGMLYEHISWGLLKAAATSGCDALRARRGEGCDALRARRGDGMGG